MAPRLAVLAVLFALAVTGARAEERALVEAVRSGEDTAHVVAMIGRGADVNRAEPDGTTPLIWAAHRGDAALVEALLAAGADAAAENAFGATAMSEAATIGDERIVRMLLAAGVDADSANPEGETALMLVARTGNVAAARPLLDAGADVNAVEEWGGQSALMWAVAQLHPAMVELLVAHGADVDARGAVRNWTRRITAEPRPKDMHKGGFTPLLYAARGGCVDCARHLLSAGADPDLADPDGVTPLVLAIINYHYDFASLMIDAGADVNLWDLYGRTPLYVAVDMNTIPVPRRLDLAPRTTPLELAERLLAAGANPNSQLRHWRPPFRNAIGERGTDNTLSAGATPLLRAAHASDVPAIRLLLEHGALVDLPNASGITPLLAAAGVGVSQRSSRASRKSEEASIEAVGLLLEAGADVHARTHDPRRLHTDPEARAAIRRLVFPVTYRFADLPPNGTGVLHGAARFGWNGLIDRLVEAGAEVHPVDADGRTPLDFALARYEPAPTVPPPEPMHETAERLQWHCERQRGCDPASMHPEGGNGEVAAR